MTALNIKYHMHPNDDADIIVGNYHGEEKDLAERIRKTKIFRKVFYVREYIENATLHRYFRYFTDGGERICFFYALRNSLEFIKIKFQRFLWGPKAYISNMIQDAHDLNLEEYEALFLVGSKIIACNLLDYVMKYNKICKINVLDEGIGSYVAPEMGKYKNVEGIADECYVYDPEMVLYKAKKIRVPRINKSDTKFIGILNTVFRYHEDDIEDYSHSIIFFDQGVSSQLPKYLQSNFRWVKWLFHNAYKRHLQEEKKFCEQVHTLDFMLSHAGKRIIWIKPHPRSSRDILESYKKRNIKLLREDVPWELIALNCSTKNTILVTNFSSAVCLHNAVQDAFDNQVQCLLLYHILKERIPELDKEYYQKLQRKYDNLCIPATIDELTLMLQ